jgi:hypothetical protein
MPQGILFYAAKNKLEGELYNFSLVAMDESRQIVCICMLRNVITDIPIIC